jgi:hypothetical protein
MLVLSLGLLGLSPPHARQPISRRAFIAEAATITLAVAPARASAAAPGEQGSPFDWSALWKGSAVGVGGEASQKSVGQSATDVAAILARDLGERRYILTGDLTPEIFADDCRFVDPNNAVTGLSKYRQALSFLFEPTMSSVEDVRVAVGLPSSGPPTITADYVAQGQLKLPWKPRISPWRGHIVYTLDSRGLIVSQVDEWSISRFTALRQTFGLSGL